MLAFDHEVKLPLHQSKLGHAQRAKFKTDNFWQKLSPALNLTLIASFLHVFSLVLFCWSCFVFYFGLNDSVPLHKLGMKVVRAIRILHNFW